MSRRFLLILALAAVSSVQPARAYVLFGPYDFGGDLIYPKWGDNHAGMPGGTVTWSIMPDGTTIDPSFNDPNISGTSSFEALMGALGEPQAMAAIHRAFDRWSEVANIYFEQVDDSGLPFNHAGALPPVAGHIRIGAFAIAGNAGAVGYAGPPNGGTTLEGDILFNSSNHFQFAAGNEGNEIDFFQPPTFFFHNDFEGLLLHEIGHTLGIAHSDVCSVMSVDFECFKYLNRIPDPDDVAAAQFLYGPALRADFDHDNGVTGADLMAWRGGFGLSAGSTPGQGDANRDLGVDGADFLIWQRELGAGAVVTAAAVPEPNSLAMALAAVAAALRNVRGRCRSGGTWRTTWAPIRRTCI